MVDLHPSASPERLQLAEALRAGRLDSRMLYATPRQAALWCEVARRHSPVYTRPDFGRVYEKAFARIAPPARDISLVGVGCGTGEKEAQLFRRLARAGRPVAFSAIDVSDALVGESAERLADAGAVAARHLVCDLNEADFLAGWLNKHVPAPRIITFFGLVPNFAPSQLARILRALLRPQDVLLASVHLVPEAGSMREILPQYDNPQTLAWLAAALATYGLDKFLGDPVIEIGEVEGIPAFLGRAVWKSEESPVESFQSVPGQPLTLFQSLRYTPTLFDGWLKKESLAGEQLALTDCGEEGIWSVKPLN